MDPTGRKRRIAQLEESLRDKDALFNIQQTGWRETEAKLGAARNQIEYLVRTIRQMDDIIFSMGQAADGSWKSVQPRFSQLHDQMTARKVAESNRIGDVLRGELIETYAPNMATKQIGSKK